MTVRLFILVIAALTAVLSVFLLPINTKASSYLVLCECGILRKATVNNEGSEGYGPIHHV